MFKFRMFWPLTVFLILTEGLLLSPSLLCGAQEYYVTPTQPPNTACPSGKPCHTLNDYAKNASSLLSRKDNVSLLFLDDNVSLLFLDGMHPLTGQNLEIFDTVNLIIAAVNTICYTVDGPIVP